MVSLVCQFCCRRFEKGHASAHIGSLRFCSMSCRVYAQRAPGGSWTANHTALLLAVAASATDAEMAELFGFRRESVLSLRRRFGFKRTDPDSTRRYTPDEDMLLMDLYPHVATSDLAKLLDRTESSIYSRSTKLRLSKTPRRLIEAHHAHRILPREVRDLIALNEKVKRKLREEHSRSARAAHGGVRSAE
jgi:hypothetical protein